jgi:methionyl-tRNA formyltransferase
MWADMTIYHFTNTGFGSPFLPAWQDIALRDTDRVVLVFSVKKQKNVLLRLLTGIKNEWKTWRLRRQIGDVAICWEEDVNSVDFRQKIRRGDVAICTGFNQIFSPELLTCFEVSVNVHPSVLPYYRGPVPSHWCLLHGEMRSGYTLHRMTQRIDAGEILFQETCPILDGDTPATLDQRIAQLAARTFQRFVSATIHQQPWEIQTLDASTVYKTVTHYKSFP